MVAKRLGPSLVVGFCLLVAVLGVFPYGALYAFPGLAALTLREAYRWVRVSAIVIALSLGALTLAVQVVGS